MSRNNYEWNGKSDRPFCNGSVDRIEQEKRSGTADASLPVAQKLAQADSSSIHLLTVIPTFSTVAGETAAASSLLPATASALLDIKVENAAEDLQEHLDELKKRVLQ